MNNSYEKHNRDNQKYKIFKKETNLGFLQLPGMPVSAR